MKTGQFLLLKLMEECVEVGQRCSKQIQFGKLEVQKDQSLTNAERLKQEILDIASLVQLLHLHGELPELTGQEIADAYEVKRKKLQKYLDLSYDLGELPKITI
jgi:NTP pyrophosphatase (non-canonical NTP hydrolase)